MNKYHRRPVGRQENLEIDPRSDLSAGQVYAKANSARVNKLRQGSGTPESVYMAGRPKRTDTAKMADGFNMVRAKRTPAQRMAEQIDRKTRRK